MPTVIHLVAHYWLFVYSVKWLLRNVYCIYYSMWENQPIQVCDSDTLKLLGIWYSVTIIHWLVTIQWLVVMTICIIHCELLSPADDWPAWLKGKQYHVLTLQPLWWHSLTFPVTNGCRTCSNPTPGETIVPGIADHYSCSWLSVAQCQYCIVQYSFVLTCRHFLWCIHSIHLVH